MLLHSNSFKVFFVLLLFIIDHLNAYNDQQITLAVSIRNGFEIKRLDVLIFKVIRTSLVVVTKLFLVILTYF